MKDKKNISRVIIGIFGLLLIVGILKTTYAYYSLTIKGNPNDYSFDLSTSSTLSVAFVDNAQIMTFNKMAKSKGYFFPGDSETKRFSVKNTGDEAAYYSILLDNVKNDFVRTEDLQYELYINDNLVTTGNLTNEEEQYLYYNKTIDKGVTDNIIFVLKYATTTESQNVDMNKNLSFRFNISDKLK